MPSCCCLKELVGSFSAGRADVREAPRFGGASARALAGRLSLAAARWGSCPGGMPAGFAHGFCSAQASAVGYWAAHKFRTILSVGMGFLEEQICCNSLTVSPSLPNSSNCYSHRRSRGASKEGQ